MLDEFFNNGRGRLAAPTVYDQARNMLSLEKSPTYAKKLMIFMIVINSTFYLTLLFKELETAIFLICFMQYYIVSALLIFGYLKVFCGLISLLLIQVESRLIPPSHKVKVRKMTFMIGALFLLIV